MLRSIPDLHLHLHRQHGQSSVFERDFAPSNMQADIVCKDCGKHFKSLEILNHHRDLEHLRPEKQSAENEIITMSVNQPAFLCSINHPSAEIGFKCDECGKRLETKRKLLLHIESEHENYRLSQSSVLSVESHDDAQMTLDTMSALSCAFCARTFMSSSDLNYHVSVEHATSPMTFDHACFQCGKVFMNHHDLSLHILWVHSEVTGYPCNTCQHFFTSPQELKKHIESFHGIFPTVHCKFCAATFRSMRELNVHTAYEHNSLAVPNSVPGVNCNKCGKAFPDTDALWLHIDAKHTPSTSTDPLFQSVVHSPPNNLSDRLVFDSIPQCDGNDTIDSCDSKDESVVAETQVCEKDSNKLSYYIRRHSFTLNREKQAANVVHDSSIEDFEITVNNQDTNVNIKCSSGFYASVARPAMSSFMQGTNFYVGAVSIQCGHVAFNRDVTGVEESRVLHLQLTTSVVSANVTVTLHHTTRLVQIQGGTKMPNKYKAATWFLESYVRQKFEYQAGVQKYDISKFNKAIRDMFSNVSTNITTEASKDHSCAHCDKTFKSNSVPVLCTFCLKQAHKSKCKPCTAFTLLPESSTPVEAAAADGRHNQESQHKRPRLSPDILPVDSAPIVTAICPPTVSVTPSFLSLRSTSVTSTSTITPSITPSLAPISLTCPPITTRSHTTAAVTSSLSLPVPTSSVLSRPSSQSTTLNPSLGRNTKHSKKSAQAASPEQSEINFLKLQLNTAITRITQLDNEISDYEKRVQILLTTVKSYEERDNKTAYEENFRNFPRSSFPPNPSSNCNGTFPHQVPNVFQPECRPSPCTSPSSSCCGRPPCNCSASCPIRPSSHHCSGQLSLSETLSSVNSRVKNIETDIVVLKTMMKPNSNISDRNTHEPGSSTSYPSSREISAPPTITTHDAHLDQSVVSLEEFEFNEVEKANDEKIDNHLN